MIGPICRLPGNTITFESQNITQLKYNRSLDNALSLGLLYLLELLLAFLRAGCLTDLMDIARTSS